MRIVTVYFEPGKHGRYDAKRLLDAYLRSADALGVPVEVVTIPTPAHVADVKRWVPEVGAKTSAWANVMASSDEPVILTDCDMLMLADPRPAAEAILDDYSLAFTTRPTLPPINTGVVLANNAGWLAQRWVESTERIQNSPALFKRWVGLYAATDQAAVGAMMLNDGAFRLLTTTVQCQCWNAADEEWASVDLSQPPYFLHIKGRLREACLGMPFAYQPDAGQREAFKRLVPLWRKFDQPRG